MGVVVDLDACYAPSEELLTSEVAGELIFARLAAEPEDMEDGLYTLNATGKAVWERLDGRRSLREIAQALAEEYQTAIGRVERDMVEWVGCLLERQMLAALSGEAGGR